MTVTKSGALPVAVRPSYDNFPPPRSYAAFDGERLLREYPAGEPVDVRATFVHDQFRALVLNPQFACVAAKSAFHKNNYRFALYEQGGLGSPEAQAQLARDLEAFAREQDSTLREKGYSTFVASFTTPTISDEETFERLLWQQLQGLDSEDVVRGNSWDETVSSDPGDPHFEFSFAGRAFFVVGMHPGSSRLTRRFAFPTLVFNAHFQFEELRAGGKYGRMQEVIRARDTALQGSINPNLTDFGERSDARQYSGRPVEDNWRCPFHAQSRDTAASKELDEAETDETGCLR